MQTVSIRKNPPERKLIARSIINIIRGFLSRKTAVDITNLQNPILRINLMREREREREREGEKSMMGSFLDLICF